MKGELLPFLKSYEQMKIVRLRDDLREVREERSSLDFLARYGSFYVG